MRLKLQSLIFAIVFIALINLINTCTVQQPEQGRRLQKRMNFNFLRSWQPFPIGRPLQESYATTDNNEIDESPEIVIRTPEERIKSRLLCMNALANPAACNDI